MPVAAAWGIGHAHIDDYLGPHRATFSANYDGDIKLDLGPIGNAYLPSPAAPIGLGVTIGGVGQAAESLGSLFSDRTSRPTPASTPSPGRRSADRGTPARSMLWSHGRRSELLTAALRGLGATAPMVVALAGRSCLTGRRVPAVYVVVTALVVGSILVPRGRAGARIPSASPRMARGSPRSPWTACCWRTCWTAASRASGCSATGSRKRCDLHRQTDSQPRRR